MHSPYSYYPSSSSNASETDSSPSLSKRTVQNSVLLSRKYPRARSQSDQALAPPATRVLDQSLGPRQLNQPLQSAQSPPSRVFTRASPPPSNQYLQRSQSPPPNGYRPSRAQSPPPSNFGPSNQYLQRSQSPPPNGYKPYRAQSPPPNTFGPSSQYLQRSQSPPPSTHQYLQRSQSPPPSTTQRASNAPVVPPRAPKNEGYLREQYSPKPLRKILRKPWGKSKSVDTPYLFPYTPPPPKPTASLLNKLSNLRSKSPSPRTLDPNRKVQFLDLPPDAAPLLPQRRSRSPIRVVADFFHKKPTTTTTIPNERPRSNSLSRFVKNLGHKIHHQQHQPLDGYTSDSSITPYQRQYDFEAAGYVSDSNTRKLSVPITSASTNSIRNTFRKFSQGTVNFARSLKLSNERLADNLNDYEWTKQNLLRSSELLNKSSERYSSLYSGKVQQQQQQQQQESGVTKRNDRQKVSEKKFC